MKATIALNRKMKAEVKIDFRAALIYRQTFLSDLIEDMTALTKDGVYWTTENIEKLFGIIWAHVKNANDSTPDYLVWKKRLPGIQAILVVRALYGLWAVVSEPVVKTADEGRSRDDLEPSYSLYRYIARKLKIDFGEFLQMTPGELLDIANFETKMQAEPVYTATQADYDNFF